MDIRLSWNNAIQGADFTMVGPYLELGHDLESSVIISVFTDLAADSTDLVPPDMSSDPRGCWIDTYIAPVTMGSKLWQAFWRVRNQDTINWANDTVQKSLQWMIDDNVATSVTCDASFYGSSGMQLNITIVEPSGNVSLFQYAWTQEFSGTSYNPPYLPSG
jgi:phage gp46-like protein